MLRGLRSHLECVSFDKIWDNLSIKMNKDSNRFQIIKIIGTHESILV